MKQYGWDIKRNLTKINYGIHTDAIKQNLIPKELSKEIGQMLTIKAKSNEKDQNPKMPVIHRYIETEIERYGQLSKEMPDDRTLDWEALDRAFLSILGK